MDFFLTIQNINTLSETLRATSVNCSNNFAILKLVINNPTLKQQYAERITRHNTQFMSNILPDSGFDVLVPNNVTFNKPFVTNFIDMNIQTEMFYYDVDNERVSNTAFIVHPRSSISKTPLMLANHTGIIDAGYRGSLVGAFRWLKPDNETTTQYIVNENTRLLQICHPSLCPIYVTLSEGDELSTSLRGTGGFGSTG
jgi:dUTP pyrophosphatase